jgi:hypothetical protein
LAVALSALCDVLGLRPSQLPAALHAESAEAFVESMTIGDESMADLLEGSGEGTLRASLEGAAIEAALSRFDAAVPPLDPALRVLLAGTADAGSPLRALHNHVDTLLKEIWMAVTNWRAAQVSRDGGGVHAVSLGAVRFPAPTGVSCNMMPIVLPQTFRDQCFASDRDEAGLSKCALSLPPAFRAYLPLIEACPLTADDAGKIGYLTIDESWPAAGHAQRRPGLHTESPGLVEQVGVVAPEAIGAASGEWKPAAGGGRTFMWGGGHYVRQTSDHGNATLPGLRGAYHGGLFIASTVAASTAVWNARVSPHAVGKHGSLEHLRACLGEGYRLPANAMVWLTDATPHESLPLPEAATSAAPRQFFRLVTSRVSGWYRAHSTANDLGVTPPPEIPIIDGDKFAPSRPIP